MALVGEAGPERLALPSGAAVMPLNKNAYNNISIVANYNVVDKETAEYAADALAKKLQGRGVPGPNR